jgi:hypothetical protein
MLSFFYNRTPSVVYRYVLYSHNVDDTELGYVFRNVHDPLAHSTHSTRRRITFIVQGASEMDEITSTHVYPVRRPGEEFRLDSSVKNARGKR